MQVSGNRLQEGSPGQGWKGGNATHDHTRLPFTNTVSVCDGIMERSFSAAKSLCRWKDFSPMMMWFVFQKKKDAVFCFGLSEFLAGENQMQAMQLALVPARRKVNDGVGGAA